MLRARIAAKNGNVAASSFSEASSGAGGGTTDNKPRHKDSRGGATALVFGTILAVVFLGLYGYISWIEEEHHRATSIIPSNPTAITGGDNNIRKNTGNKSNYESNPATRLSTAFDGLIQRAQEKHNQCHSLGLGGSSSDTARYKGLNDHDAHLASFGFLKDLEQYDPAAAAADDKYPYQCILPPPTECSETQVTVIFMAYNPDRLQKMLRQIKIMMGPSFHGLVQEVVVVWNGERKVDETELGRTLLQQPHVRIEYPLLHGFPNDLFNRYHPRLNIRTKAILYYDDDGPFYSYDAILGGFELWKRHAHTQIGAMARKLDFMGSRQTQEQGLPLGPNRETQFVSHCEGDELRYNYFTFTQFDAKMVLPSGSFLHSQYLACLWHPLFTNLHRYIQAHPVHPDDGTVSMMIAQLSGHAPKVYSRRINAADETTKQKQRRLLEEQQADGYQDRYWKNLTRSIEYEQQRHHRRLMDGINWDAPGAHEKKMDWGRLRSDVANSLARYFGSVNGGSLGWCFGTPYHQSGKEDSCQPDQAKIGMIPWMNPDHTAKSTCP